MFRLADALLGILFESEWFRALLERPMPEEAETDPWARILGPFVQEALLGLTAPQQKAAASILFDGLSRRTRAIQHVRSGR